MQPFANQVNLPHRYLHMIPNQKRIINISLRSVTLGVRFVFIVALAKFLTPTEVGYYGLFTATAGYVMLFAGLDFYTYATREILRLPAESRGKAIKAQVILAAAIYIPITPIIVLLLSHLGWPTSLIWWFIPILLLEHFNQELSRILIALSEQVFATVVLFIRQGSWAIAMLVLLTIAPESRHLSVLFPAWAIAGIIAAALGVWKLKRLELGGGSLPVDWAWVRKGLYVGSGFLVATLALRATQTLDRYWLEALADVEVLAAYVLFYGMAAALLAFLDAGVFAFAYPRLIEMHCEQKHVLATVLMRNVLMQTLAITAVFVLISLLVMPSIIQWLDNPVYQSASDLFVWVLLAMVLNAIGLVPHYGLYAQGRDRPIILSHIAGLIIFISATWLLADAFGGFAIPMSLALSFLVILVWKTFAYIRLVQAQSG